MNEADLRHGLLAARDARQRALDDCRARRPGATLLMASTCIPGPDKFRPGASRLLGSALDAFGATLELEPLAGRQDLLGAYRLATVRAPAETAKRAAMALEQRLPAGRLLDLDVYRADGDQVGRAQLGAPARPCLVCAAPAGDCMALGRHGLAELLGRVDSLLRPLVPEPGPVEPEALAAALTLGARRELDLTPKPGLVDLRDRGSHPDLSHAAMARSVDLLALYYDDLLRPHPSGRTLADAVRAGEEAEQRMFRAIQANAHRGYIFLSGLVLLAACAGARDRAALAREVARLAREFFPRFGARDSHGAQVRLRLGLGGIRREAERGLPAVFEAGWPAYREALDAGWEQDLAAFYLMAVLMQRVEDSTAVSRCGPEGLARLRRDGARLQRLLERGKAPLAWLAGLNRAYVAWNLTMGGVADCMALVFALEAAVEPRREWEASRSR
jgi:triphosphoribosyl-dephospho-CoA synthase